MKENFCQEKILTQAYIISSHFNLYIDHLIKRKIK